MTDATTSRAARRTALAALFSTVLVAAGANAQTASYSVFDASCANAAGPRLRLGGTPPVRGGWARVVVSGPARKLGTLRFGSAALSPGFLLTRLGMSGCRTYLHPLHLSASIPFRLNASGHASIHYFTPATVPYGQTTFHQVWASVPGANPAGKIWSNGGRAIVGAPRPLGIADIRAFAPEVRLHPDERYMPMSPSRFIAYSRFRHHRSWRSDQGWNKRRRRWVTTNSHHGDY